MKLIDKDAIVAEINRIKKEECPLDLYEGRCKLIWVEQFLFFINNLEIKEIDLEDEFDQYLEKQNAYTINGNGEIKYYNGDSLNHVYDIYPIAKYFFELGLKTQK